MVCTLIIGALTISAARASAQTDPAGSVVPLAPEVSAPQPQPVAQSADTLAPAPTTTVVPKRTLIITGKGFGHGRGLGQWGAFGYATLQGWSSRQILDHYYGGTIPGGLSPTSAIGVRITNLDSKPLTLFQPKGRLYLRLENDPGYVVPPAFLADAAAVAAVVALTQPTLPPDPVVGAAVTVPTAGPALTSSTIPNPAAAVLDPPVSVGKAAAIRVRLANGSWEISDAPTCSGPWTVRTGLLNRTLTVSTGPPDTAAGPDDADAMLQVCEGKQRRVYRGDFLAITDGKLQRGVNLVGMEAYLRGVVPREISASWGDRGMEAVKAQAVAARSYAAAEKRSGFSNTCDTISCQVYGGRGLVTDKGFTSLEDARTDRAIAETAGEIRVNPKNGAVIRTEFSASTGGFTAGGEFPAVIDAGDAIEANPNRSWERRLAGTSVGKSAKLGPLVDAKVSARDGWGPDGGRATKVVLSYERGSVTISGVDFMRSFALKSNYFTAQVVTEGVDVPPGALITGDTGPGEALTGDAGGPVAAAGALPVGALTDVGAASTAASTPVEPTRQKTTKAPSAKASATTAPKKNPNTTIVAVAVAVGASPVVTVSGGSVVGSPTTVAPSTPKRPATKRTAKK